MNNPFLTVVIPVYNAEKYIRNCLDSVLSQTFSNYEVLIINDASKDSSLSICQEYAAKHDKIRIISLEQNKGVMNARLLAIKEAKGEYFLSVDADDYILPNRLEKMAEAAIQNNSDIVITGFTKVVEKNNKHTTICDSFPPGNYVGSSLAELKRSYMSFDKKKGNRRISPAVWMKLIKVDLVKKYVDIIPNTIKIGEDALLSYLALSNAKGVSILDDYSYFYRIFPSQASGAKYYNAYFINALSIYTFIEKQTDNSLLNAINENIVHISAYGVMNEGFNSDKELAKQIITQICNTDRVQQAIYKESYKNQNLIYQICAKNIKKKKVGRLYFLAKICAFFIKMAS